MGINRHVISEIASNSDVYNRGEQLFYANRIKRFGKTRDGSKLSIEAQIESNHRLYETSIVFNKDGSVDNYKCSCESYSIWRGACKHVIAALFAFMEDTISPPRKLDINTKLINELASAMSYTSTHTSGSELNDNLKLSFNCCLNLNTDTGEASVSFTLGQKRQYVVKSISELHSAMQNKNRLAFGKNLLFVPDYSLFDWESSKLLRFLMREYDFFSEVSKISNPFSFRYSFNSSSDRYLTLHKRSFDEFFQIFNGKHIRANVSGDSKKIFLTDEKPDYKFSIHQEVDKQTQNKIYKLFGSPVFVSVFKGEEYYYLLIGDAMYKTEPDYYKMFSALMKSLSKSRNNLIFTGNNVEKFISVIYPSMKKNEMIGVETGDFSDLRSYDFTTKLYLHSDSDVIYCKVVFDYSGNEVNPLTNSTYLYRDKPEETRKINELISKGFSQEHQRSLYSLCGDDNIYEFLRNGINELNESFSEVYVADSLKNKVIRPISKPGFRVSLSGNLLSMTSDLPDFSIKELIEALESYETHMRYHKLKNGKFISFDDDNIVNASEFLSSLDLNKKNIKNDKILIPKYKALYLDAVSKKYSIKSEGDGAYQSIAQDFQDPDKLDFEIPEHMESVLRGYQKIGYKWLKMLSFYGFGGILADDMGLGKTIQVIALLSSSAETKKPSMVICPASVLYNWRNEIKRFSPEIKTLMVAGAPDIRKKLIGTEKDINIVLTTYDLMKRDIEEYSNMEFEYIIADEAQNIKNPSTQNAKCIKMLNGRVKFALTGTPIENNLTELWSIVDFIMPGYLGSHTQFSKKYETPIVKDNDTDKSERLKLQISPFIMRRLKKDVLTELPEKTETTLYAEMYPEQKKLYTANLFKARGDLDKIISDGNFSKNSLQILSALTRLRQICCHPSLFIENYIHGSGKLDLAMETITIALESGHRILLFSQFTSMLNILKKKLEQDKISFFYLDGSTNIELRTRMADKFNSGDRQVFLISLKAGGTGLNLTGADVVIHYDQWWNPAVMDQASDRAYRFGQERAVQIFNLVARDSIEERILELQQKKKGLIDSVIVEGGNFINRMSEQEVLSLFDN